MPAFKSFILDLDGTVYLDSKPIDDVITVLNELRSRGSQLLILTNNTSISKSSYQKKLATMGLALHLSEIINPAEVTAEFLKKKYAGQSGYWLCTPDFAEEMQDHYQLSSLSQDNADQAKYVLLTFDRSLTYQKLQTAAQLIGRGIPYYLTNIDFTCPTQLGPIPDCGLMAEMLKATTGRAFQDHFGKPGPAMARYLLQRLKGLLNNQSQKIKKTEILLAGDRLYTDLALGKTMKVQTLLVFSGETRSADYKKYLKKRGKKADFTAPTLAQFIRKEILHN